MSLALALALAAAQAGRDAGWNRVVAALQLVGEEAVEAFELPEPERTRRQQQLARRLAQAAQQAPAANIRDEIEAIRTRLLARDYEVGTACRALVRTILERFQFRRIPRTKPDLARGKKLYVKACAACHGPSATGDSAIGAAQDPRAGDILHPKQNWAPYDMYNRVTYGGAETAMPSFEEGLSEPQRWDIVFYLFAERWPPCDKPLPPLRADELALLGDYELGNRFGYGAAACLRRHFLPPRPPRR
jgi:mono/diheme cytochrome c family protein